MTVSYFNADAGKLPVRTASRHLLAFVPTLFDVTVFLSRKSWMLAFHLQQSEEGELQPWRTYH